MDRSKHCNRAACSHRRRVCLRLITDHPRGAASLAGVVLVLGILMAIPVLMGGSADEALGARPEARLPACRAEP
jgi:hypothetical protein